MIRHSAIYEGWVRHRRMSPSQHQFRYQVFMIYLDLAEQEDVFRLSPLCSQRAWSPVRFCRDDFFGNPSVALDEAVRRKVEVETGYKPEGPIRLLANWRYWGHSINPIVCYYCFDTRERLQAVLAEVTNTPWKERHAYVLSCDPESRLQRIRFQKRMHVSPFNPMNIEYDWKNNTPGDIATIHLRNLIDGDCNFDATIKLQRKPLTSMSLHRVLVSHPCMTLKVASAIYWNALRLWFKRTPIYTHPENP